MDKMTHKERALKTFEFEPTDRPAFDLMENAVWPELAEFFSKEYNLNTNEEVLDFLDSDIRWAFALPEDEDKIVERETFADDLGDRFLGDVESVEDLDKKYNPQPEDRVIPDFKAMHDKYPNHSLIFCPLWLSLIHIFSKALFELANDRGSRNFTLSHQVFNGFICPFSNDRNFTYFVII